MSTWLSRIWADPTYGTLMRISIVQVTLLAAVCISVAAIRWRRNTESVRTRAFHDVAQQALLALLAEEMEEVEVARVLRRLPRRDLCSILERYTTHLRGGSRETLEGLYGALGLRRYALRLSDSWLWWRRLEGIRLLGAMGGGLAQEVLVERLGDKHDAVRLAAARALAQSRDISVLPSLIDALGGAYRISRRQLAETLIDFGPRAWPSLRETLQSPPRHEGERRLHTTILEVLALSGDLQAASVIQDILGSEDMELRIAGYKAIMLLHLNLAAAQLRVGLRDKTWEVRSQAAKACGHAGHLELVEDLGVALSDDEWWVRFNAARALEQLGPEGRGELERVVYAGVDSYARDAALQVLTEDPAYAELYAYRVSVSGPESGDSEERLESFIDGMEDS